MIVKDGFDQDWCVGWNVRSVRRRDYDKLVLASQKEALSSLLLDAAPGTNLELHDADFPRLKKLGRNDLRVINARPKPRIPYAAIEPAAEVDVKLAKATCDGN